MRTWSFNRRMEGSRRRIRNLEPARPLRRLNAPQGGLRAAMGRAVELFKLRKEYALSSLVHSHGGRVGKAVASLLRHYLGVAGVRQCLA